MRAYNARLKAIPAALDTAITQSKLSDAAGIRAPKFEVERVISGGGADALITGSPFNSKARIHRSGQTPEAKMAKLQSAGKVSAADADALLS